MTHVYLVAAGVGFLLLGFLIQRAATGTGTRKYTRYIPVPITGLCLAASVCMAAQYNTGEATLDFLLWFFAAGISLFLLTGMILACLIGRILDKSNR